MNGQTGRTKAYQPELELSEEAIGRCYRPEYSVEQFDCASIDNITLACMRVEKKKFSRDSIVLTQQDGKYKAGRVRVFLSHAPPGQEDCSRHEMPNIAEVAWFAKAVPTSGCTEGLADSLGCTVFKRAWEDDPTGNLCLLESLVPCKLASLPHRSHPQNLVVVSRFASFLKQVPA